MLIFVFAQVWGLSLGSIHKGGRSLLVIDIEAWAVVGI